MNIFCLKETTPIQQVLVIERLVSKSFNEACALVFADPTDRFYLLNIRIKCKAFPLIVLYAPNEHAERQELFRRIEQFLARFRRVDLVGDYNDVFDTDLSIYRQYIFIENEDILRILT